jgi:tetratricopeptide (TPR) repeat protein
MLYLPTLSHGFVWDDTYFLTDLPFLRDPDLWWRQIGEPLFVSRNYFRPLPLLTFVVEARLGGLDPFLFHLTNIMLHAANTTLVVLLTRAVVPAGVVAAAIAGLLFAIHPVLVESVAWISDRFDLMMVFFALLALFLDYRLVRPNMRATVVGLLFMAALLCKETAIVLLVLLPLWQAMGIATDAEWKTWPRRLLANGDVKVWAALLLALLAYLVLRHAALGYFYQNDSAMVRGSFLQHLLLIGKTFGWYVVLAVWPFGLALPVHPAQTPVATGDVGAWLGLAGLVIAFATLALVLLRKPEARRPALAGVMTLAALAPVSNLVPLTIGDNLVHDRYLILPLAFLVLVLVLTWDARRHLSFFAVLVGWVVAALITVVGLVPHWENNLTLWSWAYVQQPGSRIARENYVAALVNANRNEETVAVARMHLAGTPDVPETTHNLALALARLGEYAEAERIVRRAIQLYPGKGPKGRLDFSEAYNLLGYIHLKQGRNSEAEQSLRESIALAPYLTRPHYNLALLLFERGDLEGGDRELAFAVRYGNPELAEAHQRLGSEARKRGQAKPD